MCPIFWGEEGEAQLVESGANALTAFRCCIKNNCWAEFLDWRDCRAAVCPKMDAPVRVQALDALSPDEVRSCIAKLSLEWAGEDCEVLGILVGRVPPPRNRSIMPAPASAASSIYFGVASCWANRRAKAEMLALDHSPSLKDDDLPR